MWFMTALELNYVELSRSVLWRGTLCDALKSVRWRSPDAEYSLTVNARATKGGMMLGVGWKEL